MVAILTGTGWYLAGKIRSEALVVEPCPAMPAYDDVRFVGLSPGQARLVAIGSQPAMSRPALYGVAWQGGIGHEGHANQAQRAIASRLPARRVRWMR